MATRNLQNRSQTSNAIGNNVRESRSRQGRRLFDRTQSVMSMPSTLDNLPTTKKLSRDRKKGNHGRNADNEGHRNTAKRSSVVSLNAALEDGLLGETPKDIHPDEENPEKKPKKKERRRTVSETINSKASQQKAAEEAFQTEKACWYFALDHYWREICLTMVESEWFERVISVLVMGNTAILASYDPMQDDESVRNSTLSNFEMAFAIIFTVEAQIKITAWTFYSRDNDTCYIKNPWNQLDFMCVIAGLMIFIPTGDSDDADILQQVLEFFAYGRLLRPLRNLRVFPGMRYLVLTCLSAADLLKDVFLLLLFFQTVFAVMALQMWVGNFGHRCYSDQLGSVRIDPPSTENTYDGHRVCSPDSGGYNCPIGYSCLESPNPGRGSLGFDNIAMSLMTIFQVMTLDRWTLVAGMAADGTTKYAHA